MFWCCCGSSSTFSKTGNSFTYTGGSGTIDSISDPFQFGEFGGGGVVSTFWHFTNVAIAPGTTILSAWIRQLFWYSSPVLKVADMVPVGTGGSAGNFAVCDLKCEDVDDATRHTSYGAARTAALTTAGTTWSVEYGQYTRPSSPLSIDVESPDFTSSLQEVIDRPGWASGNKLNVHFRENGSDADYLFWIGNGPNTGTLFWTS